MKLNQDKSEALVQRCSVKKVFLEIPVNFATSIRIPFLTEHLRWLSLTNFI